MKYIKYIFINKNGCFKTLYYISEYLLVIPFCRGHYCYHGEKICYQHNGTSNYQIRRCIKGTIIVILNRKTCYHSFDSFQYIFEFIYRDQSKVKNLCNKLKLTTAPIDNITIPMTHCIK